MGTGARSEGLRRGLEILGLFTDTTFEWGITDISREMGLHKSRVHRAVKTLEDVGFLRKNPKSQKYALGIRAFELGVVAARRFSLTPEVRPLMQRISTETKAGVSVRVLDGEEIVIVESVESSGVLRVHSPAGARRPWDFGAGGKLFAAYSSPDTVRQLLNKNGLTRYTDHSITDETTFLQELNRVREQGYSFSDGEHIPGVFTVAAPIMNPRGELMAALLASIPSVGMLDETRSKIINMVVETASSISENLKKEAGLQV